MKVQLIKIAFFTLLLFLSSKNFSQNITYIDPGNSGDPGQNGSIDHPYDSWFDFSIANGKTYLQKRGTTSNWGGSQIQKNGISNVTIGAYGTGAKPVIKSTTGGAVFYIWSFSHWKIQNIEFRAPNSYAAVWARGTYGTWTYLELDSCVIKGGGSGGAIHTDNGDSLVSRYVVIDSVKLDGYLMGNTHHIYIGYNRITHINSTDGGGDGIQSVDACNYPVIEYNYIDRSTDPGNKFCIILNGESESHRVKGAIIRYNQLIGLNDPADGGCIYLEHTESVDIYGNEFYSYNNVTLRGTSCASTAQGVRIYYNIYHAGFKWCIWDDAGAEIYNNILISPTTRSISTCSATKFRNNIFYISPSAWGGSGTHSNNCYYNVTNPPTETGGIIGNPLFVDYANGNYHLQSTSPCINSGYSLGLPCDYEGTPVPQGPSPDKGSYEWMDNSGTNNPPQINAQTFSVAENTANGQQVGTVIATDPDAGQTLTYTILSGNTNNAFQIGSSTGVLTVNNSTALNYETTPTFTLVVKVQDNGNGSLSAQANVTVTLTDVNEPPQINPQTFNIVEFTPNGQQVGQVIATDPDNGQTISFVILSGNTSNAFALNSSTGIVTVSNSSALNSAVNPVFNLLVKVTDNGSGNLTSQNTVTVNVTDINQPPQINNQTFSIAENTANGQQVGTVIATDPDVGQTLTYTILSGNTNNAFQIGSSTGTLTVNNSTALNFETTPTFNFVVKVQDNGLGSLSAQANITVNLTDVNEPPQISNQTFSIAENTANGQQVGLVIATDPDIGQNLTYTIQNGNTGNAFLINSSSGMLTVNNDSSLNYEVNPWFSLFIKIQDDGPGNLYVIKIIHVILTDVNEPPQVSPQSFSIAENTPNGQQVGLVIATDPDIGQNLTYTIQNGNTGNAFLINSSSGMLIVNNDSSLNYEVNPWFSLFIKIQDDGPGNLYVIKIIHVILTDVNEPPQVSPQSFSIAENTPNGQQVGLVIATDPDIGQNLTYTIQNGNTGNAFLINSSSGMLIVNNDSSLNYEVNPWFSLFIKIQDDGPGNLYVIKIIHVILTDVNEPPQLDNQSITISEHLPNGSQLGEINATDPDNGQFLTYTIVMGNTDNAFVLNSSTGILSVNNSLALDYQTHPFFHLIVKAMDNGSGNLFDYGLMTILLNQSNDNQDIDSMNVNANEHNEKLSCNLYPNPTVNNLNIDLQNLTSQQVQILITNSVGVTVYELEERDNSGTFHESIDISNLTSGLYFAQVRNGKNFLIKKFIKQ